jgi:hypothetical protein
VIIPGGEGGSANNGDKIFKACVMKVLTGRWKFEGLRKQKYLWQQYLTGGARVVKKLTTRTSVVVRNRAAE